jgi:hypothetical protein
MVLKNFTASTKLGSASLHLASKSNRRRSCWRPVASINDFLRNKQLSACHTSENLAEVAEQYKKFFSLRRAAIMIMDVTGEGKSQI